MGQFTFPTAKTLLEVEQKLLPTLTASNPIFSIFPTVPRNSHLVEWEQLDNFQGLMSPRGLDGKPPRVVQVGSKSYQMTPGVYGEHMVATERQLTAERQWGTLNEPLNVTRLVSMFGNQLLHRQLMRKRWIGWQLLVNGIFTVTGPTGAILHADSYSQRIYSAAVAHSTVANSTPLQDFRNVQLLARGFSIALDQSATAYGNRKQINYLLANTNAADLGGKRMAGLSTVNSLNGINEILTGEGLPNIVANDDGWEDESGNFNQDIPDGYLIVVGRRVDNSPIGHWAETRNSNNPGFAPGSYLKVFENPYAVPANVEVHRGFNGGIELQYPSAIIVMKV